ncbi:Bdr family repetitive protein [Borreliella valaisiana]|uniref:Bdr family repetitive protein n=1 Tax=Borreliella valaisiana TaxID=62088 RepID=UPI002ED60EAD|nr:Bdr family repetitive protein [Borreliella valaisiana]WVN14600.1 Bdr family repetitive protein [Borreliella valaisiana]
MRNLTYRTYNIESIINEFLNIGFSEEAIDFVFLYNDNYNFEYLKEKSIDVEKNLQKDISNLDIKIDTVEKNLRKDLNMGNRLVHFMILAAAIFGPFIHSFLMQYNTRQQIMK